MATTARVPQLHGRRVRVAVVSSVHRWNDTRVYLKQTQSLVRAGYDVILVAVCDEPQSFESSGVRVLPLPRRKRVLRWLNWLSILRASIRHRADIVHGHDPELFPLLALMRLGGMRVVCDVHEDVAEQILHKEWVPKALRRSLSWLTRIAQRGLPKVSDGVILAEDSYRRNFPDAPNLAIVRNFPLLPPAYKQDYGTDVLRLVYVGDVRAVRGIETYIRVTHKLAQQRVPVELRVVGSFADPEEERRMHALVAELRLDSNVKWLGRRPPEEVPALLLDCDIGLALLHPIGNYRESYPTKMFEYMAAGLPVVVSNFALWTSVVVENGCGSVVDPINVDDTAAVLMGYWKSSALRERHGVSGRRAVEQRYQWDVELQRMLQLYAGLHRS